jgi:hypothetical protein
VLVGVSFLLINVGGGHGIETITTITTTTTTP